MAELTQKIEILLDRLYNLKGEDNILLKEIVSKIEETQKRIEISESNRESSELNRINCEGTLELFLTQKKSFEEAFEGLDNDTFAALRDVNVNLEIGTLLDVLKERSPKYCEDLSNEIEKYQQEIDDAVIEKNELISILVGLENKKSKAEEDKEQLNSLLEQSLSTNDIERDSLTAHYVKKIISQFNVFSDEELSKLTKLIMFPDEGLYRYAQTYEDRLAKGLIGVTEVTEEEPVMENEPVTEVVTEPPIIETEPPVEIETEVPVVDIELTPEITTETSTQEEIAIQEEAKEFYNEEPVIEIKNTEEIDLSVLNQPVEETEVTEEEPVIDTEPITEVVEETIEEYLNKIGINPNKYQDKYPSEYEDIKELLKNTNKRELEENYEVLRSISLDDLVYEYVNGYMYLTDAELNRKLTLLRAKGVSESTIKALLQMNTIVYDLNTLENKITAIEKLEHRIDSENIYLLGFNVEQYANNLENLSNSGYELDEKEIRNHNTLLMESNNIPSDINVLKEYLISIVRNNGKYALSVFWKTPEELIRDIDLLIENDLENIIVANPEILAENIPELIKRVKYCEEKGEPIYEGNGKSEFCEYISSYLEFNNKFGSQTELPELTNINNDKLAELINNQEIINILNNSYANIENVINIKINEDATDIYQGLRNKVEEKLNAESIGKYTYKINDVCISKNKYERNLIIILNSLYEDNKNPNGMEREIILAAALYNLAQAEEVLEGIVNKYAGVDALGGTQ